VDNASPERAHSVECRRWDSCTSAPAVGLREGQAEKQADGGASETAQRGSNLGSDTD
jgi:hypothetical protein